MTMEQGYYTVNDDINKYLQALYGNCDQGQIVFIEPSRNKVSAYFDVKRLDLAAKHIQRKPADLFMKINPMDHTATRKRDPFGIGGKAEVKAIVSLHLDVDAGKNDKYLTPQKMLEALDQMPLTPSMIINSDGADGGFHAYWLLDEPHYIIDDNDRQRCQDISNRWLEELREHAKPGSVDGTGDLCRYLRPVGSLRKSGNYVVPQFINENRRYSLDQFLFPEIEKPEAPIYNSESRYHDDSESVIEKYLSAVGLNSVAAILSHRGYRHVHDGFWIRPGSQSGAPTGEIFTKNGREGFTVKSGAADPLSCVNRNGGTGNWYSTEALFVSFENNCDASNGRNPQAWKDTAKFCHEYFDPQKPKVDLDDFMADDEPEQEQTKGKQEDPKPKQGPTVRAGEILTAYLEKLRSGTLPQLLKQYSALQGIEVGPGLLTVIGAPPGQGKTALASQIMFDGLELDDSLTTVIANAETSFESLLRREFTRMTRINSDDIRFGNLTDYDLEKITEKSTDLLQRLQRVQVLKDPHSLDQMMRLITEPPGLLIVDYIQKFAPVDKDARQGVNMVMNGLRMLAKKGWSVLALSSTSRSKDGKHNPKDLSMSSFKESGEVEFNADACYLLLDGGPVTDDKPYIRQITLTCVKNRHGAKRDIPLIFHMPRMEFSKPVEQAAHTEFANWSGQKSNPFSVEPEF